MMPVLRFPSFALVLAALVSATGAAQPLPAVGSDATLDVATWNITWFGATSNGPTDEARQFAHVRRVLAETRLDLWALQEIADPAAFDRLVDSLGAAYGGRLATLHSGQRVAFVYDRDVLEPSGTPAFQHILTGDSQQQAFAGRPPLRFDARVTLPDTTFDATFVVLHMKAFADADSYARRVRASGYLKNYLDTLLPDRPVVVLGDFNDQINGSIRAGESSPYLNFLQDPFDYRILTRGFETAGVFTFCGIASCEAGSAIDHILVTDAWFGLYHADSAARLDALVAAFASYTGTTSDHLPVVARFGPSSPVALPVEPAALPAARDIPTAFPNPFRDATTLAVASAAPGPTELTVVDALGRRVWRETRTHTGGTARFRLDTSNWPAGVYVARLHMGGATTTVPLVRGR